MRPKHKKISDERVESKNEKTELWRGRGLWRRSSRGEGKDQFFQQSVSRRKLSGDAFISPNAPNYTGLWKKKLRLRAAGSNRSAPEALPPLNRLGPCEQSHIWNVHCDALDTRQGWHREPQRAPEPRPRTPIRVDSGWGGSLLSGLWRLLHVSADEGACLGSGSCWESEIAEEDFLVCWETELWEWPSGNDITSSVTEEAQTTAEPERPSRTWRWFCSHKRIPTRIKKRLHV